MSFSDLVSSVRPVFDFFRDMWDCLPSAVVLLALSSFALFLFVFVVRMFRG